MRDKWFCGSCGTVPLTFFCMYKIVQVKTADSRCHSLPTGTYIQWLNLLKGPPPPHTHKWRRYILRVEGGFHGQYRGNVHLWPKSDESKKSLVLFYLFTLWPLPCVISVMTVGSVHLLHKRKSSWKLRLLKQSICTFIQESIGCTVVHIPKYRKPTLYNVHLSFFYLMFMKQLKYSWWYDI